MCLLQHYLDLTPPLILSSQLSRRDLLPAACPDWLRLAPYGYRYTLLTNEPGPLAGHGRRRRCQHGCAQEDERLPLYVSSRILAFEMNNHADPSELNVDGSRTTTNPLRARSSQSPTSRAWPGLRAVGGLTSVTRCEVSRSLHFSDLFGTSLSSSQFHST